MGTTAPRDTAAPLAGTGRLEAFSDGVIAITLLVLEIKVPEGTGSLATRLAEQWPVYVAYLVSFVVVGATWLSHHHLIRDLRGADHGLLLLNLALLLVVSAVAAVLEWFGSPDLAPVAISVGVAAAILFFSRLRPLHCSTP